MTKHLGENWVTLWDTTLKDENTHCTPPIHVGTAQEKAVFVKVTKTTTPGNLTLKVQLSPDNDLYADLGDAVTYTADGTDVIAWTTHSEYMRLYLDSAATTDASKYWTIKILFQGKA